MYNKYDLIASALLRQSELIKSAELEKVSANYYNVLMKLLGRSARGLSGATTKAVSRLPASIANAIRRFAGAAPHAARIGARSASNVVRSSVNAAVGARNVLAPPRSPRALLPPPGRVSNAALPVRLRQAIAARPSGTRPTRIPLFNSGWRSAAARPTRITLSNALRPGRGPVNNVGPIIDISDVVEVKPWSPGSVNSNNRSIFQHLFDRFNSAPGSVKAPLIAGGLLGAGYGAKSLVDDVSSHEPYTAERLWNEFHRFPPYNQRDILWSLRGS